MEIVATFEADGYFAVREGFEHVRHVRVAGWCDEAAAEFVTGCCIKACGNNDKVGIEFVGDGHNDLLENVHVIAVTHAFVLPRYVDVPKNVSNQSVTRFNRDTYIPTPGPSPTLSAAPSGPLG